ncbi:hypothetical protein DICVIV_05037 [Dictyocaulus viviparus]|uniref:E3 SUMO-protein ligase NSE2 n=1 Tax=Dictyocaulus viviparus TaxID=29172 RepID=A0A0D8XYD7_DICVI|nr:hypothetical protein DICVIV_05037 [Dictyocaulus viviparus]
MIRSNNEEILINGLSDVLQMVKSTPLFEQSREDYLKVLTLAEKLDIQISKDNKVLKELSEIANPDVSLNMESLMEKYEEMCSQCNVTGAWSNEIIRMRSCCPQEIESFDLLHNKVSEEEEVGIVEVVKSRRDPLGGGEIRDPVKNKLCGHVYDRTTLQEYIKSNRARRAMFYQCPYSLCTNKKNMDMRDMMEYPEFFKT